MEQEDHESASEVAMQPHAAQSFYFHVIGCLYRLFSPTTMDL
jgi:hypothetical protein